MKRKFTIFVLSCLCLGSIKAQTSNSRDSLKAIYDNLPVSYYPSNILHNRSPLYRWSMDPNYMASPYKYPGSIPANLIKKSWWNMLVNDMNEATINPALIPDASTFSTRDSIARQNYDVPIAAAHLDFHQLVPGAVDSGYVWYDTTSQRLSVMPDTLWLDRPNGIYEYYSNPDSLAALAFSQHEVFVGALSENTIYKPGTSFTVTFGLVSSLFMENQTEQITYLEMDFDNGGGFQPVQFDVPKTVSYSGAGSWENFEKVLRLRLHYGTHVVETRMPLTIVPDSDEPDTEFFASSLPLKCNIPTNGFTPGEARVSIRYGNAAKKLMKPVVLVEGFESAMRPYGDITYRSLSSGVVKSESGDRIFEQAALLSNAFDSLVLLGYDIVYIDNRNARDHIQANALNTIKTIQWINDELASNGSQEKLVVIGASMGGLVSRYALSKMEADGCCHNVRLYGTFDSPHNGAHIPLGLQATIKHLHDELGWVESFSFVNGDPVTASWAKVLNSPGAQQMLAVHLNPSAANVRQQFMTEYDSLDHPQQCRQIAIVNGSEQALANTISHAQKQYILGETILPLPIAHTVGTTWGNIGANLIGIPAPFPLMHLSAYGESRSNGIIFQANDLDKASKLAALDALTHGVSFAVQAISKALSYIPGWGIACNAIVVGAQAVANVLLPSYHVANLIIGTPLSGIAVPPGTTNYSEAPGSTSDTPETIEKSLFGLATATTPTHNFIPSVSALDLDTNNLYLNVANVRIPLMLADEIPFDTYWAPGRGENPDVNMQHIQVTKPLYQWMIEQIDLNDQLRDQTSGAYSATLSGYYNFGRPADFQKPFLKHLNSVDVVSGGTLYINKSGVIGYPGSSYFASGSTSFDCYTGSACDAPFISIQNGGLFEIGHNFSNNEGNMYFQKGSILELQSGSTLRISANSTLVIEEGAELIIHPGATIELAGESAVLELKGKLTLRPSAIFEPTGTGFVRFAQVVANGTTWADYLNFEGNNEIRFSGSGFSDKRAEVVTNTVISSSLSLLKVSQCRVAMSSKVFLGVHSPLTANGAHFTAIVTDSSPKPKGLRVYGQAAVAINNCLFSHCCTKPSG